MLSSKLAHRFNYLEVLNMNSRFFLKLIKRPPSIHPASWLLRTCFDTFFATQKTLRVSGEKEAARGECRVKRGVSNHLSEHAREFQKKSNKTLRCVLKKICIFLVISIGVHLFFNVEVQAVIVGSKTSASAQTFTIFPSVDSNNTILGYTRFEDGFMLEGATTSCTYEGYMPISGTVHLNKGRLTLKRDLVLSGVPLFLTTGRIEANSFALELPKNLPDFNFPEFNGFTLNITASYHLGTHAAVPDALSLDWAMNNDYVAVGMRSVSARELRVLYFNGTTLTATVDAEIGREVCMCALAPD
jgi:hypothetical protein